MARHQFKKGDAWNGNRNGRPKGSKKHSGFNVEQILKDLNYCPFTHLYKMATDENWAKRERTQAAIELCGYVAPKLKAMELSATQKEHISVMINCNNENDTEKFDIVNNKKEENG